MPVSNTCVKTGEGQVAMAQIPYPDAPGPGQALIRTRLSTICGSDIHVVDDLPVPPGVPASCARCAPVPRPTRRWQSAQGRAAPAPSPPRPVASS
ncbi:MAG: hypothetical protein WHT63_06175, partial [Tepidiforma sp.]